MFARLTAIILQNRLASSLVLVAIALVFVFGAQWLRADFSIKAFFVPDDPETAYLDEYLERWGEDDVLILVFDSGEPEGLLTRARLEGMEALSTVLSDVEGIGTVLSLTQVPQVNRGVAGTFIPVPLISTAPKADADPSRTRAWRDKVLSDSRIVPGYLSEDGRYGSMLVALDVDNTDLAQVAPVVHRVEEAVEAWESDGVTTYIAGVPAIRADIIDVIVRDQLVLAPVAGLVIMVLLWGLFRSKHGVLIPGVAAAVPIAMLIGTMGWTGEPFGLLNQVFLALVPAIAVADAIHFISRYHEESEALAGDETLTVEERDLAIQRAMQTMGVACFLTSFTTIVGFLSLLSTGMNVLRMFGVYAAVGVAFAYFTVLFIVPLALLGTRSSARRISHDAEGALGAILEVATQVTTRFPVLCLAGAVLAGGVFAYAGSFVEVDTKVTESFDEAHPTTKGNRLVDEHLGGVLALEFDLHGEPGTFAEPEVLAALHRAETYADGREEVRGTFSPAQLLKATSMLIGGPDEVPSSDSIIRTLYRVNESSPIVGRFVNEDRSRARLIVRVVDVGAVDFLELGRAMSERFRVELFPLGVESHLTGSSFVAYRGLSRVTSDLFNSLLMAFGVIGIIISLLFRNLRLGMLSLLPNTLPLLMGYGMMGLLGWTLEPAPTVVFTIAIGITVDSAIHIIARFMEERRRGVGADAAIRDAIFHSGRAVVITTIILMVGFAVNAWSSSPANASFGRIGTIVIFGAILSNLFVLPALLKVLYGRNQPVPESALM